ncbi:DUF2231 domain-containing protein [Flavobacterium rhizosphaerae]|uniref:DUF2231 domain-containing protein n=1 Tax=Flavobacterium rhizosphaerae TaxID=3163298 RepID=A0ABW8Z225_9FLAO
MNGAHFHLVVNHFPIISTIIALLVLIAGLFSKSVPVQRTGYFIFILAAITTIVALQSGEGAEEVVEHLNIAEHQMIHKHEEAAETFAIFSYTLGALSLLGIWLSIKKTYSVAVGILILVISVVTIYFASQTGTTGGEIRHTEIREGSTL